MIISQKTELSQGGGLSLLRLKLAHSRGRWNVSNCDDVLSRITNSDVRESLESITFPFTLPCAEIRFSIIVTALSFTFLSLNL